jgi:lipoprotein-releasing system ATP-binding protein
VLKVAGVGKKYVSSAGEIPVLSDVSFSLVPGDAAAIMGPSGSGKSTLLYIVGALEPPTTGSVTLNGTNPFALSAGDLAEFRNKQIGFVFQDHCLLPQCNVLENVLVPTLVGESDSGADAHARSLIEQVGLGHRAAHVPAQLSGGEKQRVALARALVRRPQLLLCDEPTGNLDRTSADVVSSLLLDLQRKQNAILIVVTHSAELAARFPIRFDLIDGRLQHGTAISERPRIGSPARSE